MKRVLLCHPLLLKTVLKPNTTGYYLKYLSCDYQKSTNTRAHHTDKYVNKDLVVRRSQAFDLYVNFKNRSYDASKDAIVMEFTLGRLFAKNILFFF